MQHQIDGLVQYSRYSSALAVKSLTTSLHKVSKWWYDFRHCNRWQLLTPHQIYHLLTFFQQHFLPAHHYHWFQYWLLVSHSRTAIRIESHDIQYAVCKCVGSIGSAPNLTEPIKYGIVWDCYSILHRACYTV